MTPPHQKTPDYPRSNLARYMAQVMQLFNPACEGSAVIKVEQACDVLWDALTEAEQAVATSRVQILYTLFGQPKHTPLLPVVDQACEDWYLAYAKLHHEPHQVAADAWAAGKRFADETLTERLVESEHARFEARDALARALGREDDDGVAYVEIEAATLKCPCGHDTWLAPATSGGKIMCSTLVGAPNQACEGCGEVWFVPATADCEISEEDR